mgnify:CR=1 FL=1
MKSRCIIHYTTSGCSTSREGLCQSLPPRSMALSRRNTRTTPQYFYRGESACKGPKKGRDSSRGHPPDRPALFCSPPAGSRHRRAIRPGVDRPQKYQIDPGIQSGQQKNIPTDPKSPGCPVSGGGEQKGEPISLYSE